MLGSAKTNLLLLTLTSWVKVASPLSQSYLKLSKLLYKVIYNLSQNFVKVVPKLTQICLKLQCFCMTIQISSYAFVFLCPNNSLSWTWRNSSAGISPGEPKTWPTPPVLRSPINLSWFAVSRGSAETETETLSNNQNWFLFGIPASSFRKKALRIYLAIWLSPFTFWISVQE